MTRRPRSREAVAELLQELEAAVASPAVLPQVVTADKEYGEHILRFRTSANSTLRIHIENPESIGVLATATDGTYTVTILNNRQELCESSDRPGELVAKGLWMDFTEDHWGITDEEYQLLPRSERAAMEAREQLRYMPTQYATGWLETYHPGLFDALFMARLDRHWIEEVVRGAFARAKTEPQAGSVEIEM